MDYPRMLYKGGDVAEPYVIVNDVDAEKSARADGYLTAHEKPKAKTGRKPAK